MAAKSRSASRPAARPGARPSGARSARPSKPNRTPLWIALGVVVLVAAVALGIVAATGGDDGDVATSGTGGALTETAPVTVTGTPLPAAPNPAAGQTGPDTGIGLAAPELAGTSFDGTPVTIAPGDGTPHLVLFVAHWCPHCQREVPLVSQWIRDGKAPAGLDITAVSTGVDARRDNYPPSAWLQDEQWPTPVLADDEEATAATAYGLSAFPFFVVVDAQGRVVDRFTGEISMDDLSARLTNDLG